MGLVGDTSAGPGSCSTQPTQVEAASGSAGEQVCGSSLDIGIPEHYIPVTYTAGASTGGNVNVAGVTESPDLPVGIATKTLIT